MIVMTAVAPWMWLLDNRVLLALFSFYLPWHCWLGIRKNIRPVKLEWWGVVCWCDHLSGARFRLFAYGPANATAIPNPIVSCIIWIQTGFYHAMLCIRGSSHGRVSICLSVTIRSSTKVAKRRITQTTPHNSHGTLVFWCQRSPRNSTGVTPYGGTKCRWGGSKSATFDK